MSFKYLSYLPKGMLNPELVVSGVCNLALRCTPKMVAYDRYVSYSVAIDG